MSSSDGHSYITFGWIATIIGVLLFFAVLNSKYAETQQSSEYAHKCAEQYKRLSSSPTDIAPLPSDQEKPARAQEDEYNPDWCDLAAQQSMAESTYWMNVAAIATVIFTAWGAFLIWRTLIATQETVTLTRRIGEAQTRAYLTLGGVHASDAEGTPLKTGDGATSCCLGVHIRNTGQSPARSCSASYAFLLPSEVESFDISDTADFEHNFGDIGGGVDLVFRTDNQSNDSWFGELFDENMERKALLVTYTYRDVFGQTYRGLTAWRHSGAPLVTPSNFSLIRSAEIAVGGQSS